MRHGRLEVYSTNNPGPPDRVDRAWFTAHLASSALTEIDQLLSNLRKQLEEVLESGLKAFEKTLPSDH